MVNAKIFLAATVVFFCLPIVANIYDLFKVSAVLDRHQYKVVEGTIDRFAPMAFAGRRPESFVVGGVKFSYSDLAANIGFHHSAVMGGPIHGGEYVRIDYTFQAGNDPGDTTCHSPLIIRMEMAKTH